MSHEEIQPEEEKQSKEGKKRKGKPRAHGTGSVFQRKDRKGKQWVAQIILGNGKTRQIYCKTQKEAEDTLNDMLYEYRRGTLITEKDQKVKQHFEGWLEIHKSRVRKSTYLQYRMIVHKHILPILGNHSLQKLSARDLDALYARKLEEGLTPAYIRDIHVVLHMALKQAVRWRLIANNVSEDVSPPRESQSHQRQILTPEQAQKLLAAAKGHRLAALLTLALTTGMRRGELLALRWRDIDMQHATLQVQRTVSPLPGSGYVEREPKTAKSRRTIKLPHFVMDVLREHHTHQLEARLEAGRK
jgi:integrase